ncbi:MAG: ArnT family glycosyltransferase [Pyrinomonadaceae bacterium]
MQIKLWLSHARALSAGRKMILGAVVCLLLGMTILLLGSRLVDTREPHLRGALNDQVAYTITARSLLTKGTLQSNTVLPSTLWQQTTRDLLYMPGHPAAIAVSYKLFGVGAFQSIIPSLLSYLIAMLAIYLIGARLYSPGAGLVAGVLFALFPPVLFFAYTAMAELTFLAAFSAAVCACIFLPHRLRPWLGPFCLTVPFLFRETAAFVALPLGLYFWLDRRDKLAWRSLVFVTLSIVLLSALYRSDFSAKRPSVLKANVFGDWHSVYDDAPAQQAISNPNWRDWMRVLPGHMVHNLAALFFNRDFVPWAAAGNYVLMLSMVLVGLMALFRGDKLAWSLSALNIIAVSAAVTLVGVSGYRGVRYLMFTYALSVVVIAPPLIKATSRVGARRMVVVVAASAAAAALSLLTVGVVRNIYKSLDDRHLINRGQIAVIEIMGYALAAGIIGLFIIWRRRKRRRADALPLTERPPVSALIRQSYPALTVIAGTALVTLSCVFDYPSMGYLLLAYAFSLVWIAWLLAKVVTRIASERLSLTIAVGVSAVALLLFSLSVVKNMYTFFADQDVVDSRSAAALETVGHDNARMLVTPFDISIRYRYDHFPVPWAFAPYNQPTLQLLVSRFDVGTLILPDDHLLLQNPAALAGLGFYQERVLTIDKANYVVYKRSAP